MKNIAFMIPFVKFREEDKNMDQMHRWAIALILTILFMSACSSPVTTREQGGLIGAGLGAGAGAIIGSTVGHAAVGALIGGPVGAGRGRFNWRSAHGGGADPAEPIGSERAEPARDRTVTP